VSERLRRQTVPRAAKRFRTDDRTGLESAVRFPPMKGADVNAVRPKKQKKQIVGRDFPLAAPYLIKGMVSAIS